MGIKIVAVLQLHYTHKKDNFDKKSWEKQHEIAMYPEETREN